MRYEFGPFALDEELFVLTRDGERVPLRPQALELLLHLVRNRDRVVTKRELHETIWAGASVSSASLPHAILSVRRAIDDDGETIIETVRGLLTSSPLPSSTVWTAIAWCVGLSLVGWLWARSAYRRPRI